MSRWSRAAALGVGVIVVACMLVAGLVGVRAFLIEIFRAPSSAMLPTVPAGSLLVVQKLGFGNYGAFGITIARTRPTVAAQRGDIVVFEYPVDRRTLVFMRVVGVEGDRIDQPGKLQVCCIHSALLSAGYLA